MGTFSFTARAGMYFREFTVNDDGVAFDNGKQAAFNASAYTDSPTLFIPLEIYGYYE